MKTLGSVLELIGFGLLCLTAYLVEPLAGLASAGVVCLLLGLAIGREQ